MLYLLLSIICATSLTIILRLFEKWNIRTEYGIVLNYLACCITGLLVMPEKSLLMQIPSWNGWWICLLLGLGFMFVFIMIGKSVKLLGITTTSIAYKLSFIIPAMAAILFYGDSLTAYKVCGIVLAIFAIYFITNQREERNKENQTYLKNLWLLPVIIFVGAGSLDALFNFIQRNYAPPGFDHIVTITVFAGAFLSGILRFGMQREMYRWKNFIGGIILGIPNYGSLYFLLQALKHPVYPPSTLFPLNNLGIVCLSAIAGWLLFKERFTFSKIIGFILTVASIIIIGFLK
ncbi:MAG: hypothetical protein JWN78_295 [Bacteroidota bacterium]|nr:hypothetical protein [Bacteroidota bacterium]